MVSYDMASLCAIFISVLLVFRLRIVSDNFTLYGDKLAQVYWKMSRYIQPYMVVYKLILWI